jgi:hypothetical protein
MSFYYRLSNLSKHPLLWPWAKRQEWIVFLDGKLGFLQTDLKQRLDILQLVNQQFVVVFTFTNQTGRILDVYNDSLVLVLENDSRLSVKQQQQPSQWITIDSEINDPFIKWGCIVNPSYVMTGYEDLTTAQTLNHEFWLTQYNDHLRLFCLDSFVKDFKTRSQKTKRCLVNEEVLVTCSETNQVDLNYIPLWSSKSEPNQIPLVLPFCAFEPCSWTNHTGILCGIDNDFRFTAEILDIRVKTLLTNRTIKTTTSRHGRLTSCKIYEDQLAVLSKEFKSGEWLVNMII